MHDELMLTRRTVSLLAIAWLACHEEVRQVVGTPASQGNDMVEGRRPKGNGGTADCACAALSPMKEPNDALTIPDVRVPGFADLRRELSGGAGEVVAHVRTTPPAIAYSAAAFFRLRFAGAGFSGSVRLRPSPDALARAERSAA